MILCGLDTGTHLAPCVVDASGPRPRLIHTTTIQVGHREQRKKPRIIRLRDGATRTITDRLVVSADDIDAAMSALASIWLRYGVARVVVEFMERMFVPADAGPAVAAAMGTHLGRMQWLGGEARRLAITLGCSTRIVTRARWARDVCGSNAPRGAGKTILEPVVRDRIDGWPEKSNEHERDAAGLVLYDLLIAAEAAAALAPKAPPEPRVPAVIRLPRAPRPDGPSELGKRILEALAKGPLGTTRIAVRLGVERPDVAREVVRLHKAGLVERPEPGWFQLPGHVAVPREVDLSAEPVPEFMRPRYEASAVPGASTDRVCPRCRKPGHGARTCDNIG